MSRRLLLLALLIAPSATFAQEADYREDLRFVEKLRQRNDNDLAEEFLKKIEKDAPAAIKKELPLEFAKTRLRRASDETETAKRLALYLQARKDFETFIKDNPTHPRVAEANLEIARVLNLQGKTELNRAYLSDDKDTKTKQLKQALDTLQLAAKQLEAAEKVLKARLDALPDPDGIMDRVKKQAAQAAYNQANEEVKATTLERGLNLFDQAQACFNMRTMDAEATNHLEAAKKTLDPLAGGAKNNRMTWTSIAWIGRIIWRTETNAKARLKFTEVISAGNIPAAAEGVRLARYFRLLVIQDKPEPEESKKLVAILMDGCVRWRNDYRAYWKSPEGCGVAYMLANLYADQAAGNKKLSRIDADRYRAQARALATELESSENEFTELARQMKIRIIGDQGGFKLKIDALKTFEDCYVRAQYEIVQMNDEIKKAKDDKAADAASDTRTANIIQALKRGLAMPEVKKMKKATLELNTARAMLAYWTLSSGKLEDAIAAGEAFARDDPRSSQASMSCIYALRAYSQLVAKKQKEFDKTADKDRAAMISLCRYAEERWPKETPGDLARHMMGYLLFNEQRYPDAIKVLSRVTSGYGDYVLTCALLADCALRADQEKLAPIPGDREGDYRKRYFQALERMPESALGVNTWANQLILTYKVRLGEEMYRYNRFKDMEELVERLSKKLGELSFSSDPMKSKSIADQKKYELANVKMFAKFGQGRTAFNAGDRVKAAELLDPLVDSVNKDGPEKSILEKNLPLGRGMLSMAMRANLQQGKIDRADSALEALQKVDTEGAGNALQTFAVLIKLQIEDLKKSNDKAGLTKTIEGAKTILNKRVGKQKPTPELIRVLADCYTSMEEYQRAADELEKVADPKPRPKTGSPEDVTLRQVQFQLVKSLRLTGKKDNLKKARKVLEDARGTVKSPGWARRDLGMLKEFGMLMEAEGKYNQAVNLLWSPLIKQLAQLAPKNLAMREHLIESYYHLIFCLVKNAMSKKTRADRDKYLKEAAQRLVNFEKEWPDFGGEESKKRFTELLSSEPAFRDHYRTLSKKKKK